MKNSRLIPFFILLHLLSSLPGFSQSQNKKKIFLPGTIKEVGILLDSIHLEDQKHRSQLEQVSGKYGWESKQVEELIKTMRKTDSSNLVMVAQILDTYGWLSSGQIGKRANSTLFLVIQHSNQPTQEQYLPMMRQAVKEGKASAQDLALLEDRILLGKRELQVYGSQIGRDQQTGEMYVLPLLEPEKVNERRAQVGLMPIEEYIAYWNLTWDVEEYKKKLPGWTKKLKEETRR